MFRWLPLILLAGCGSVVMVDDEPSGFPPDLAVSLPGSCEPNLQPFKPEWRPPTELHQARCTSGQLDSFFAIGLPGGLPGVSAWSQGSNGDCFACLLSSDADPFYGPIVNIGPSLQVMFFVDGNSGGCVAQVDGAFDDQSCGARVQSARQCETFECASCPRAIVAELPALDQCMAQAATNPCDGEEALVSQCLPSVPGASVCFPSAYSSTADWLRFLSELFCGAPSDT